MQNNYTFLIVGIAPPVLYALDIIKGDDPTPVIIVSVMGFIAYAFMFFTTKSIYRESNLIDELSEKHNIPRMEFKKVFTEIYHSHSGVSNSERVKATLKHFNKST
jgi:hypothetical protein